MAVNPIPYQPNNHTNTKDKFGNFVDLVHLLRSDEGCPWDRDLKIHSLREKLIEEAYETVDAINSGNYQHIADELGDLLLHVVMHATIAQGDGEFTIDDVMDNVTSKLIRRHPHVFGEIVATSQGDVEKLWSKIKSSENSGRINVPASMSPMEQNITLQSKAQLSSTDTVAQMVQRLRHHVGCVESGVGDTVGGDTGVGGTGVDTNEHTSNRTAGDTSNEHKNINIEDAHHLGMIVSESFAIMLKCGHSPLSIMSEVNKAISINT